MDKPNRFSETAWLSQLGATAVEYAIMIALIAAVIIAAVIVVGDETNAAFDCVGDRMAVAPATTPCP